MNADHARYEDWDAAYLLGALGQADRALYEAHLAECERCRAAIAEIAPTLGLLSRVDPGRAESLLRPEEAGHDGPGAGHRARVLSLAAARDRRRRRLAIVAVAAAVVIAAVVVPVASSLLRTPEQVIALEPVAELPLSATVELTEVAWGTRIDMSCAYGEVPDAPEEGWAYALVVVGADGAESVLSTWRARPGSTARLSAATALASADIAAVEIRAVRSGDVLMRSDADLDGD
ncbi:zf-HC2 domain-containing protein [Microbacterium hydrocarbonoxydans]|uniref:zf-HC2 domain-containing protein n=1 Tax=Microbacterium hydrocarbonoxydans TaxID=273678 RepID=UPI0007BB2420|nr:zf-HC2 domain-containing protein [Microbacterium hydrocarbonoxydans]GAT72550.1 predicted transmembrane transcriptional regulator [Microbacterium sp. HM58-2]